MTTTLEITPEYFTSGDFDSRNRFIKKDTQSGGVFCNGITWELGSNQVNTGFPWLGQRWNISGIIANDLVSYTVSGNTQNQTITEPSNTITRVGI